MDQTGLPWTPLKYFDRHAAAHLAREISNLVSRGIEHRGLLLVAERSAIGAFQLDTPGLHGVAIGIQVVDFGNQLPIATKLPTRHRLVEKSCA